ncbi:hypothetical protein RJ639_004680 [Escallonia herrerae]|uniref:CONSTANS-like protein n=1 Tax=Escallonia herrerae TaxID=1293975 RepID=A0AA88W148_9ASTE|nr:hypothetical protein RJ639_004680 [Escallonia herrerae]
MGGDGWSLSAKLCESCKRASASLFCRADSAFLCVGCDAKVHAANKLASRHARVWMCEVCEQAPASVTCKADAAALCVTCDRDIHSANPLALRHERVPVVPFYDSAAAACDGGEEHLEGGGGTGSEEEEEEAEAASWLLPNPNPNNPPNKIVIDSTEFKSADYLFNDMDPYLDLDVISPDQKAKQQQHSSGADGVVPVQQQRASGRQPHLLQHNLVDGFPAYDMDYAGSKPFLYNFNSQSISQSLSSSSLEVGVVPDHNAMADVSNTFRQNATAENVPTPITRLDREARVLRYREKRKNRKFEKTIRYASRKAYAETRPRIKGRFAKRAEIDVDALIAADASYGVVPSY